MGSQGRSGRPLLAFCLLQPSCVNPSLYNYLSSSSSPSFTTVLLCMLYPCSILLLCHRHRRCHCLFFLLSFLPCCRLFHLFAILLAMRLAPMFAMVLGFRICLLYFSDQPSMFQRHSLGYYTHTLLICLCSSLI